MQKLSLVVLRLRANEAMALWDLLDRVTAGQAIEADTLPRENREPLRWVRERLALLVQEAVEDAPGPTTD